MLDFIFFLAALIMFVALCGGLWLAAEQAWLWWNKTTERRLSWKIEMMSWWYTVLAIPTSFMIDLRWRRACLRHGCGLECDQTTEDLIEEIRRNEEMRRV